MPDTKPSSHLHFRHLHFLWLSFVIVLIDQFTKHMASIHLLPYRRHIVNQFLNLTLVFNTGAAFAFLSGAGGWQVYLFSLLAVVVSIILLVWMVRLPADEKFHAAAIAMIIAGALGNLADRVLWGHVIDFIDFHVGTWHWPAFNVADSAITCGALILVFLMLFKVEKNENTAR